VSDWVWSRILKSAVADSLLGEVNSAYVQHIGALVKPDGTPVPIAERFTAVASARVVPWLFLIGEYVALTKVPDRFAAVMTLKDLASLVGGIYWESEGAVLVKLDTLVAFVNAREERMKSLLQQA